MTKKDDVMLTTFDNPFNPFDEFESWFKFDMLCGYETCGKLANESNVVDIASDEVNERAIVDAMKRMVSQEPLMYKIVRAGDYQ